MKKVLLTISLFAFAAGQGFGGLANRFKPTFPPIIRSVIPTRSTTTTTTTVAPVPSPPSAPVATGAPAAVATDENPLASRQAADGVPSVVQTIRQLGAKYEKRTLFVEMAEGGSSPRNRLVEIITQPNLVEVGPPKVVSCMIYGDGNQVSRKLGTHDPGRGPLKHVTPDVMKGLMDKCQKHVLKGIYSKANKTQSDEYEPADIPVDELDPESPEGSEGGKNIFEGLVIYPGTKWCGAGNIADNYDDLGLDRAADACCRDHDMCESSIPAGGTKYNLTNKDSYTKSACSCDEKFSTCLKEANTYIGHQIARTFFNVIQIQCFREDHPIVRCVTKKGFAFDRVQAACQEYELDRSAPKQVQFFDPPFYAGNAGPLIYIPGVSDAVNKPLKSVKDKVINAGILGEVIG